MTDLLDQFLLLLLTISLTYIVTVRYGLLGLLVLTSNPFYWLMWFGLLIGSQRVQHIYADIRETLQQGLHETLVQLAQYAKPIS